jgi:opacity protein-like surface antigen
MMNPTSFCKRSILRVALAILSSAAAHSASAQIVPGLVARPDISGFGTFTANVTPDFRYFGDPAVLGYTLGGFLQTRTLIGVEVRGSIQRRLNAQHQESALAGPRLALHFGPFSPYVSILGGAGNGWRFKNPPIVGEKAPKPIEGVGGQWTVLGGLDFHLTHHVAFRLGEISYSKIYLKDWSLTPLNLSAGIVYRLN